LQLLGRTGATLPFALTVPHLLAADPPPPVVFTDITVKAGLGRAQNISGSPTNKQFLLEEMGCGVALFDYDNDGWLDIFLVNGTSLDPAVRNRNPTSYLFHNNHDGTFTDVTEKARLTRSGWGQGCCVGDYDNDGFDDLFVTYFGRNVLYHNNGDGTFTDVSEQAGVAGSEDRWGAGCCFLDYDRDGQLDLFVANYVNFDPAHAPKPGQAAYCMYNDIPVPCGPLGFAGGTNILYRNRGNGTFADVSDESGIARPRGPSSMVFVGRNWQASFRTEWERLPRTSITMDGRISTLLATALPVCSIATIMTVPSAKSRYRLVAPWMRMAFPCLVWALRWEISMPMAGWTLRARISPNR